MKDKERIDAALLSAFVIPGAGQFKKKQRVKGYVLAGASLIIAGIITYKAVLAALEVTAFTPPAELILNAVSIAQKIAAEKMAEFSGLVYGFIAVWLVGVIDAYFAD